MMKVKLSMHKTILLMGAAVLLTTTAIPDLMAQPDEILLNHVKQFIQKRRPPVPFPHGVHMERFECLACHHKYENGKNVLDEDELEEGNPAATCTACHNIKSGCNLQKVFHRQCLECHVNKRPPGEKYGPRMCIGCHLQENAEQEE